MEVKEEDNRSPVCSAARYGSIEVLSNLIKAGHSVSISNSRGWYPLHEAAWAGHLECLKLLLNLKETDVNLQTSYGCTALDLAARAGNFEAVKILLKSGADPNLCNPLCAAVEKNHERCVKLLLRYKADVNAQCIDESTAVHAAARFGNVNLLKMLLNAGGNVGIVDDMDRSPTFVAAECGESGCLQVLVDAGGDVNGQNYSGTTPLSIATREGHTDCVDLLIRSGADPNLENDRGYKPVHVAVEEDQLEALKLLLPKTNLEWHSGAQMNTPLHCTTFSDSHLEAAKIILDHGIDVNTGFTPSNLEMPPEYHDYKEYSPLYLSFCPTWMDLFNLFLSRGAKLECEGFLGCYVIRMFTNTIHYEGFGINGLKILFNLGVTMDCECLEDFSFIFQTKTIYELEVFKFMLDSGFLPKLDCYNSCLCDAEDTKKYNNTMMKKALSLAISYIHPSAFSLDSDFAICPGLVKFLKDSNYWQHIKHFIETPPPLQHLCRLEIWDILESKGLQNMEELVSQMDITEIMKHYLLYEDALTHMIMSKH